MRISMAVLTVVISAAPSPSQFRGDPAFHLAGFHYRGTWYALGDVDLDGFPDLLASDSAGQRFLRNQHGLGFVNEAHRLPQRIRSAPGPCVLADFDADGAADVVATDWSGAFIAFRNLGGAGWEDRTAAAFGGVRTTGTLRTPADLDGNGLPDLIVGDLRYQSWLAQPGFRFVPGPELPLQSGTFRIADLDGDRDGDVVYYHWPARAYRNDGGGVFTDVTAIWYGNVSHLRVDTLPVLDFADLDGDGDLDSVHHYHAGLAWAIWPLWNDGTGRLSAGTPVLGSTLTNADRVFFMDMDADGDVDLPGPYWLPPGVYGYVRNDGGGTFTGVPYSGIFPYGLNTTLVADFDADGDVDQIAEIAGRSALLHRNIHRDLQTTREPAIGNSWRLRISARPERARTDKIAFGGVAFGSVSVPLAGLGIFQLDPASFVPMPPVRIPAPGGRATIYIPMPLDPGYRGAMIWGQYAVADPEGDSFLTNVVRSVIR